jgi:hypothetical protein
MIENGKMRPVDTTLRKEWEQQGNDGGTNLTRMHFCKCYSVSPVQYYAHKNEQINKRWGLTIFFAQASWNHDPSPQPPT